METNKQQQGNILDINTSIKAIKKHRNPIITALALILVAVAAFGFYTAHQNKIYQQQWGNLFLAELNFVNDTKNSTAALEEYAAKNKNTQAAAYAALTVANAFYQAGNYTKAELAFKDAIANGNKEIAAIAEVSLIATLLAQNLTEQAISQAEAFITKNPTHFALPQVAHHKALAQELAGKKDDAKAAYTKLKTDYPNTYYAAFAELRLKALS